jgi:hypothetical protein
MTKAHEVLRAEIISKGGATPAQADEVLDLGYHAFEKAIEVIARICSSASSDTGRDNAFATALILLAASSDKFQEDIADHNGVHIGGFARRNAP